ncbi:MAG: phenylalanine--tRNA ligase beta subunit-related protein [Candidatus Micrarchaeota archaeon]|nr:phenylalanine--tRNA ligase beta subunit-related protein [Candidatus Micrarchaeota archaeon]MCX8154265.1 phenylalanine--tRNA ligase beta subunit-related protein [Candidatus Micrarchaeota archaeon]
MANVRVEGLSPEDRELLNQLGFPTEDNYVEVTPNRPDMLSKIGIMRTLDLYRNPRYLEYSVSRLSIDVRIHKVKDRPYIEFGYVELTKSPDIQDLIEFQEKLHETFGRKRKRVAIGLHDMSEVTPPITYKEVDTETFIPLGHNQPMTIHEILDHTDKGKEYRHLVRDKYPIIYDRDGVISFPPIINSNRTRLRDTTTSIFIDVTGTNQHYVKETMRLMISYFIDYGAKRVESTVDMNPKMVRAPESKINRMLGIRLDIPKLLLRSGILYRDEHALIPPYRVDFMDWTDVAEEVAINYGYNNLPTSFPEIYQSIDIQEDVFREIMQRLGFSEVYTSFLVSYREASKYYELERLQNSVSEEYDAIRPSLEYSLLKMAHRNRTSPLPYRIYEHGRVYDPKRDREYDQLGFLIMNREIKVEDYLSVIVAIAEELRSDLDITRDYEHNMYIKSTAFHGKIGDYRFYVGAIRWGVLEEFGITYPVVIGNLFKD